MSLTRRSLLGVAVVAALAAGCRSRAHSTASTAVDDADVTEAIDAERRLLSAYDVAIARLDAVAALPVAHARDRHRQHLVALAATRASPGTSSSPTPAQPGGGLVHLLDASVTTLQSAAVRVRSGLVAALLASIAAEHAADAAAEGSTR